MAEAAKKKAPAKKAPTAKKAATKATTKPKAAPKKPAAKKAAASKAPTKKAPAKKSVAKKKPTPKAATAAATAKTVKEAAPEAPKAAGDQTQEKQHSSFGEAHFNSDKLIAELKEKDWGTIATRAFFMVFFGFLANLALMATFLLALMQFVLMVGTGKPNSSVTSIISRLATYIGQALNFLSFKTEDRPFPMDLDLPSDE